MKRSALVALLLLVCYAALARPVAQTSQTPPPQPPLPPQPGMVIIRDMPSQILSGENVGIRVSAIRNGQVFGTLVVRVNGKWSEVQFTGANALLHQ